MFSRLQELLNFKLKKGKIEQVKVALGIDKIATEYYCWRHQEDGSGVQVDLIIERADRVFNVCEIKYCDHEYSLQKGEDLKVRNRVGMFKELFVDRP